MAKLMSLITTDADLLYSISFNEAMAAAAQSGLDGDTTPVGELSRLFIESAETIRDVSLDVSGMGIYIFGEECTDSDPAWDTDSHLVLSHDKERGGITFSLLSDASVMLKQVVTTYEEIRHAMATEPNIVDIMFRTPKLIAMLSLKDMGIDGGADNLKKINQWIFSAIAVPVTDGLKVMGPIIPENNKRSFN